MAEKQNVARKIRSMQKKTESIQKKSVGLSDDYSAEDIARSPFIDQVFIGEAREQGKSNRTLSIYSRLMNGRTIVKSEEARRFGVSEKSIQRDIEEIRMFLDDQVSTDGMGCL